MTFFPIYFQNSNLQINLKGKHQSELKRFITISLRQEMTTTKKTSHIKPLSLNVTGFFLSRLKLFTLFYLIQSLSKRFFRGILYFSLLHFTLFFVFYLFHFCNYEWIEFIDERTYLLTALSSPISFEYICYQSRIFC